MCAYITLLQLCVCVCVCVWCLCVCLCGLPVSTLCLHYLEVLNKLSPPAYPRIGVRGNGMVKLLFFSLLISS